MDEDNKLGEFLRQYRNEHKISLRKLEEMTDGRVSFSHLSKIERGEFQPSKTTVALIAKALKLNINELFLMAGYAPQEYNGRLGRGLDALIPDVEYVMHRSRIPILGTIRAGQPILRDEFIEGFELIEDEFLRGREAFILRVKGNSMIGDRIYEGDRVIVVVQPEVNTSDIAVVAVNGDEATLKRVKCTDGLCVLTPSNPSMEPLIVNAKDVHIIGKVIEVRHSLE